MIIIICDGFVEPSLFGKSLHFNVLKKKSRLKFKSWIPALHVIFDHVNSTSATMCRDVWTIMLNSEIIPFLAL